MSKERKRHLSPMQTPHPQTIIDPLVGRVVMGLTLQKKLDQGGMGSVYEAKGGAWGSRFAVKILHPQFASDPGLVERFRREIMTVAQLNHEHIVSVEGCGWEEGIGIYQVMEFLCGMNLAHMIEENQPFDKRRILSITQQILSGLIYMHRHRVVHRDLKPENIFLCNKEEGESVKILDFGLAKIVLEETDMTLTQADSMIGTPSYMSPELAMRQWKQVDQRSDIYSLGVILFRLLTGHFPTTANDTQGVVYQHANGKLLPLTHFRPELANQPIDKILSAMLARNPNSRPQNVRALSEPLTNALLALDDETIFSGVETTFPPLELPGDIGTVDLDGAAELGMSFGDFDKTLEVPKIHTPEKIEVLDSLEFDLLSELGIEQLPEFHPTTSERAVISYPNTFSHDVQDTPEMIPLSSENLPQLMAPLQQICARQFAAEKLKGDVLIGSAGQFISAGDTLSERWQQAIQFLPDLIKQVDGASQLGAFEHMTLETDQHVLGCVPEEDGFRVGLFQKTDTFSSMKISESAERENDSSSSMGLCQQLTSLLHVEQFLCFSQKGTLLKDCASDEATRRDPNYFLPLMRILKHFYVRTCGMSFAFEHGQVFFWQMSQCSVFIMTNAAMNQRLLTMLIEEHLDEVNTWGERERPTDEDSQIEVLRLRTARQEDPFTRWKRSRMQTPRGFILSPGKKTSRRQKFH
ncbi:MAG: hypothetical protein CL932_00550 [Deltaproteobacteria bacterium]|nr:hypothetical protein [Deltaproteobacteria bacterium]|tara:strand:+ start:8369 stop:10450 length:2082 start_codon:yes stop_codon:yes gene_type:complete